MCNEAIDNYPHALKFAPDCYITYEIFDKSVNISTIQFVPV